MKWILLAAAIFLLACSSQPKIYLRTERTIYQVPNVAASCREFPGQQPRYSLILDDTLSDGFINIEIYTRGDSVEVITFSKEVY